MPGSVANAHMLWYEHQAEHWNEALPLGNGRIGAMVFGGAEREKICLNEDTLWSGYPGRPAGAGGPETFLRARALVLEGRAAQAEALIERGFGGELVQAYMPLGDLDIRMEHPGMAHSGEISGYRRTLSLWDAVHTVEYRAGGKRYRREMFVSHPAQVLAVKISCEGGAVAFDLTLTGKMRCEPGVSGDTLLIEGNCPVCEAPRGEAYETVDNLVYAASAARRGAGYRAGARVIAEGGRTEISGGMARVRDAKTAWIYFAVRTSFNGFDRHPALEGRPYRDECLRDLDAAARTGYEALKAAHIRDYSTLYGRVALDLGRGSGLPTDRRLRERSPGDNALYALVFHYGRYLAIAASREGTQPANLQGIWNASLLPPWSSNYTLNINTEMNYWPMLPCGLPECFLPLVRLAQELSAAGRKTARDCYGVCGAVSHHATDLWRASHPATGRLADSVKWGFWNLSLGWLAVMAHDYYRYTLDLSSLRGIYPVLERAARFFRELLIETGGEYVLCPSASPENEYREGGAKHSLDVTAEMSMSIIRELFRRVIEAAEILGEDARAYSKILPRLRRPAASPDGRVAEWHSAREEAEPEHRHLSHLYGLYPGSEFTGAEMKEACRKSLEARGDKGTGWSLAWKINLWAALGDGGRALALLDRFLTPVPGGVTDPGLDGGSYINLLCAHPPFQIDGNFGACAGIAGMLLRCERNIRCERNVRCGGYVVTLLPALPAGWADGQVKGLALPGGARIDFSWKNGKVVSHTLRGNAPDYQILYENHDGGLTG